MTETVIRIPTLTTERLTLRAPRASDFDLYAEFGSSPRSAGVGGPYSRSRSFERLTSIIGHWQLRGYGRWLVADRETDCPLGIVGLMYPENWPEPEIAWTVFASAEGRGIAFEAALLSRTYAYDVLGWPTVISCTMPDNDRSIALARRMGATPEKSFLHPEIGELLVWRHPSPDAIAAGRESDVA